MAAPPTSAAPRFNLARYRALLPGLGLSFAIAGLAIAIQRATGIRVLNPVVVALAIGIAIRAGVGLHDRMKPGAAYAVRPVLRAAIVLLGLQVTLGQLLSIGGWALGLAFLSVALTMVFTIWLGVRLKVDAAMSQLLATGTGICGASAIVAANQVVRGKQEDVTYALAVITLCGTVSLVVYPMISPLIGLDARQYGLWAGLSLHEVVQAVGAAAAGGPVATEVGTISKLARVVLLAPAILGLGWWVRRSAGEAGEGKAPTPWFAYGFLAMVLVASTGLAPAVLTDELKRNIVPLMLSASVAALGLNTDLKALRVRGWAPLILGVVATLFIAVLGLVGAMLI